MKLQPLKGLGIKPSGHFKNPPINVLSFYLLGYFRVGNYKEPIAAR